MTADSQQIDYEALAQKAMRGVVRSVLEQTAQSGLPGEHHFYISFDTCADDVTLSPRLKQKYPSEMTIVLQHRFRDLVVDDKGFEVKLTFDGIPERLVVPFTAIKVFFDPSVRYGLQFEDSNTKQDGSAPQDDPRIDVLPQEQSKEGLDTTTNVVPATAFGLEPFGNSDHPDPSDDSQHALHDGRADDQSADNYENEPTVLDTDDVASATEGAQILRLDAFRKKQT